jgi:hypothetical protein
MGYKILAIIAFVMRVIMRGFILVAIALSGYFFISALVEGRYLAAFGSSMAFIAMLEVRDISNK